MGSATRWVFSVVALLVVVLAGLWDRGRITVTFAPERRAPAELDPSLLHAAPLPRAAPIPSDTAIPDTQLVQHASHLNSAALIAGSALGQTPTRIIEVVDDVSAPVTYRATPGISAEIRLRSQTAKLVLSRNFAPDYDGLYLLENTTGRYLDAAGNATGEKPTILPPRIGTASDVPIKLQPGIAYDLTVILHGANNSVPDSTVAKLQLIAAVKGTGPAAPGILSSFNNKYARTEQNVATEAKILGRYLRLSGNAPDVAAQGGGDLRFLVVDRDTAVAKADGIDAPALRIPPDGNWETELALPIGFGRDAKGRVLAYAVNSKGQHAFGSSELNFVVLDERPPTNAPVVTTDLAAPLTSLPVVIAGDTQLRGPVATASRIVAFRSRGTTAVPVFASAGNGFTINESNGSWTVTDSSITEDGDYRYDIQIAQGGALSPAASVLVRVRREGPRLLGVEPANLQVGAGRIRVVLFFDPATPLLASSSAGGAENVAHYAIQVAGQDKSPQEARLDPAQNAVYLQFEDFPGEGKYRVIVKNTLKAATGVALALKAPSGQFSIDGTAITFMLQRSTIFDEPTVGPGITATTGEYVTFPERTPPRAQRDKTFGFNPSDTVESRISRLYYYRDAHRVAQIINRKVKSFNRQGVDMQRQLADKARHEAEQRTKFRQHMEREAVLKAQQTRQVERELQGEEQQLNDALRNLRDASVFANDPRGSDTDRSRAREDARQLEEIVRVHRRKVDALRTRAQDLRDLEARANEASQQAEAEERLAVADQFRREVAAAHADPDTYVPGVPESIDPVEQVSVSVIGEGLIHLRGPLKGVNTIRHMIHDIDSPVGQCRVAIHTVNINGEKGKRMEVVANCIQRYIDQSRFLTLQSAEMLRRATVQVAARKADEARDSCPGDAQHDRDQRYLHAFFGTDFVRELQTMDSEFLHTGNKLLSLHSMDSTSLSSALALLAMAKNSTRREILDEFQQLVSTELPRAEMSNLEAGLLDTGNNKHFRLCRPKFYQLAENARFESLRGFFQAELSNDDTMTPLQREVIRLAQILKSRLVTELEYKQRVMERGLIEDRIRNYSDEMAEAARLEKDAEKVLQGARVKVTEHRSKVLFAIAQVESELRASEAAYQRYIQQIADHLQRSSGREADATDALNMAIQSDIRSLYEQHLSKYRYMGRYKQAFLELQDLALIKERILGRDRGPEGPRAFTDDQKVEVKEELNARVPGTLENLTELAEGFRGSISEFSRQAEELRVLLNRSDVDVLVGYQKWTAFRHQIEDALWENSDPSGGEKNAQERRILDRAEESFQNLLEVSLAVNGARERAEVLRRPLDHKKLLDMLIDEMEEKYIELLEGTRAHTANVDNYIKRLTTALDDDFNTQFYHPTFRLVREASQFWDVTFGQTETTTIVANNREFAKVLPNASMEFDLPPRDILMVEAINGALGTIQDVGALANDPTFLAMSRLHGPNPPAAPGAGSTGGASVMRNMLPGLQTDTAEQVLAQNLASQNQFGANLENLIPDPAIYKFETGTGYEIRPVIQPDGQAMVFNFHYMYSTDIREPVRADEKHLGRVKRHFIDTDVQLSNFELREVSRYQVALKAARTSRGVPLFEDIPLVGVLFRPLPSDESSLQQNLILAQSTIFPTLFDLMGLRWAPVVADLDPLRLMNEEFTVRGRQRALKNRVYDYSSSQVDDFMRIPSGERRPDLYRSQETIPHMHPNGYFGPGLEQQDSSLREGYDPTRSYPPQRFAPGTSIEGAGVPHRDPYQAERARVPGVDSLEGQPHAGPAGIDPLAPYPPGGDSQMRIPDQEVVPRRHGHGPPYENVPPLDPDEAIREFGELPRPLPPPDGAPPRGAAGNGQKPGAGSTKSAGSPVPPRPQGTNKKPWETKRGASAPNPSRTSNSKSQPSTTREPTTRATTARTTRNVAKPRRDTGTTTR